MAGRSASFVQAWIVSQGPSLHLILLHHRPSRLEHLNRLEIKPTIEPEQSVETTGSVIRENNVLTGCHLWSALELLND
jgi:hypothetical protein